MKNKKIVSYIGLLAIGMLLGWFLFGGVFNQEPENIHQEVTATNEMWTCSMHPQIMKSEPGDCPICGMDLIPAERSSEGISADQFRLTKNAMALANIQTSIVGNNKLEDNAIVLSGKILENEKENAVQVSYFSGRIEQLYVSFTGEEVRKGQLLATIYSPELYAAQQELLTTAALKESQPALYKAVRNKLKLWKLSERQISQIENSGKVQENVPVYATVSGTVSEKLVTQGEMVKQGQPLLKIANLSTVWANFDVYENQMDLFKKGQEISVTTTARSNDVFQGKVAFVDPVVDTNTRTVKLRVVLNNTNKIFKPGMFVEGKIKGITSHTEQVLSIPATAILWTGKRSVVYVKSNPNQPIFQMRQITLGSKIGNQYEVMEGIKTGEEIVTHGTFTVDAAAQLQGKKSMMNNEDGNVMTGQEGHVMSTTTDKKMVDVFDAPSFYPVIEAYIDLKNALIKSDISLASSKSDAFRKALEKIAIDEREHTDDYWSVLHKASKGINKEVGLVQQRKQFQIISNKLIALVRNLKKVNTKLFVQYCPMANTNQGAYWLSKEEKIMNPYYGDAMLTCGEIKQVIE